MEIAYLLLGSNLGDRARHLKFAGEGIASLPCTILRKSAIYESEAWGFESAEKFFNLCLAISTHVSPELLMEQLLQIEIRAGRQRQSQGYTDRNLDIDMLLYGSRIILQPELIVPHPRFQERRFALVPLCEIAPELVHPVLGVTIAELLEECSDPSVVVQISPSSAKL